MQSEPPDPTLLNDDVFNIASFFTSFSYLTLGQAKLWFGQLNFVNIWTQSNIFSQDIQVGTIGQFAVSSQGHCNMFSGTVDQEITLESNDNTIASTVFVHSVQDAIFESDNTWNGINIFTADAFAPTQSQHTAHSSTLIANLVYVWESIAALLNTENTWTFLQHFRSGIASNTAAISGLLTSNSHTTSTLTITTSGSCPNVSQINAPDTSIANTAYVWSSLGTFVDQIHTWPLQQTFGNISTNALQGNTIVANTISSNGALTCVDLTSSNSIIANSALFNTSCRVPNVSLITAPGTLAANTQHITDVIANFLVSEHTWQLAQHFSVITSQIVDCSSAAVAGNLSVLANVSANNCNVTSDMSASSVTCNNVSATNQMSANFLVSNTCAIAGSFTGNTCSLFGALTCDNLMSSTSSNLTITPSTGHYTAISSGNLNISNGNINMHGGLYCDNTVSGLVFTGTTLIIDNITSPNDINLNGNFYAANQYGIQHRLLTVAYMLNGSSPNTMYPLICSITNFVNDSDDSWIVAPGYRIYLYSGLNYTSFLGDLDNTNGFQPLHASSTSIYGSINSVASIKVYYHLTQITITGIS